MKRYKVSKELDVEVEYFVVKVENKLFQAQEDDDYDEIHDLEVELEALEELQDDFVVEDGVYMVSGPHYELAVKCRDKYRALHK